MKFASLVLDKQYQNCLIFQLVKTKTNTAISVSVLKSVLIYQLDQTNLVDINIKICNWEY